jgi:alkanesulfonate monooxygenase SsuD/methylene tetrahydromethanopterin reductase-like flavin-dependent oxidoreductase (luciferase family)
MVDHREDVQEPRTERTDRGDVADLAREAEQAGWDGVFVWDDVAGTEKSLVDPWIALAAAAMVTKRVRLGALITPLARRRPWKFARETASMDHLSEGRLVVGVGAGGGQEQFGDLGDEPDQRVRGEMLDEGLEVVTRLWTGESNHFPSQVTTVAAHSHLGSRDLAAQASVSAHGALGWDVPPLLGHC